MREKGNSSRREDGEGQRHRRVQVRARHSRGNVDGQGHAQPPDHRHLPQARLRAGKHRRRHYAGADGHHQVDTDRLGKARLEQSQQGPGGMFGAEPVRGTS